MKTYVFVFLSLTTIIKLNAQNNKGAWINPFPKDGLNTVYTTTEKENPENNKHFVVKKNKIEVLYTWQGTKAPFGLITTKKAYSHYNLELEYKWGKRRFEPRAEAKKDAGIVFHVQGENVVWPICLECQIQETDTGDLWVIKGPIVTAISKDGTENKLDSNVEAYLQSIKYDNFEIDGWNKIRLEVKGSKSAKFYVNGKLVNHLKNFLNKDGEPLTQGFIGLQAEGAEITYRNVKIQELN